MQDEIKMPISDNFLSSSSVYRKFIEDLKTRIAAARTTAVSAVNREMILLYWDIGCGIVEKQKLHGWGEAVVARVSLDLRAAFPGTTGFSERNLWDMKRFYLSYSKEKIWRQAVARIKKDSMPISEFLRQLVAEIPWGHNLLILNRMRRPRAMLYYLQSTARFKWSRNVLLNQIKARAYERSCESKKIHNFPQSLPEPLSGLADEMMKSSYNLEFLGIRSKIQEKDLESRLISRLQSFILELGYGFCFIGRQFKLTLGSRDYFIDLLFYHRFLKSLVAFELKMGPFEPEYAGKMDFYLNLLNDRERVPGDCPSIGIILCAEKEDVAVEYSLKTKTNPIGVASYQLYGELPADLQGKLPTSKQFLDVFKY